MKAHTIRGLKRKEPRFKTTEPVRLYDAIANYGARYNLTGSMQKVNPRNLGTGTLAGTQSVGDPGFNVSAADRQIKMGDGVTDRLLIGNQVGGF